MTVDASKFRRKMRAMRHEVREALTRSVEANAEKLVQEMRGMLAIQLPAVAAQVEIGWSWGEAPRGAITVGRVGRAVEYDQMVVTVYARAKQGSGISATWFEFGTAPRFRHKARVTQGPQSRILGRNEGGFTGRITANPFFFTVYRANKSRVRNSLRGVLRRAVKKINDS